MATYNNSIMTADGLILLADILAGDELEFVSLVTGSGAYTSEEKKTSFIRTMKNLKEKQQTVPFSAIARMDNNQVLLKANVANDELDSGYSMTEIGVFARKKGTDDLILYCVVTAEECDYFPSHSEGQYNIVFSIKTKIDDVENVSIVFSQETYALAEDLSEHENNMQNPHNVTKEQLEIEKIDNTADADKPVSTLQRAAIDEAYQQSNLYTDTKINELVNGAPTTLDTLKEVADAIAENEDVVKALDAAIGERAKQSELDTHTGNNTIHVTADERSKWNKQSDDISALNSDLANKASSDHIHAISEITGLQTTLNSLTSRGGYSCLAGMYDGTDEATKSVVCTTIGNYRYLVFVLQYGDVRIDVKTIPRAFFVNEVTKQAWALLLKSGNSEAAALVWWDSDSSSIFAFINKSYNVVNVYGIL